MAKGLSEDFGKFGYAIEPLTTCPHEAATPPYAFALPATTYLHRPCLMCADTTENWVCMCCHKVMCSRYVNAHMAEHAATGDCTYAVSFSDLSAWCFECNSYITSPRIDAFLMDIRAAKFADREQEDETNIVVDQSDSEGEPAVSSTPLTMEELGEKLRDGVFQNIIVLAGAGISTSSGIPDFRSQSGLYSMLDTYGAGVDLQNPTLIFSINYFKQNPIPFYTLSKNLFYNREIPFQPTPCHHFLRLLQDKGFLRRIYTQNIDGK